MPHQGVFSRDDAQALQFGAAVALTQTIAKHAPAVNTTASLVNAGLADLDLQVQRDRTATTSVGGHGLPIRDGRDGVDGSGKGGGGRSY